MRLYDYEENEDENENRPHRCDINTPRSKHGRKYSKYKNCLTMIMLNMY